MEQSIFLILESAIIIFLIAGLAVMEAGFTRAKNSGDVMIRCIMGFGISVISFLFIGKYLLLNGSRESEEIIHMALMSAVVVSIFSGALAGRMKFSTYLMTCIFMSAVLYPLELNLMGKFGFQFYTQITLAGVIGGTAAFSGGKVLGARIGKYTKGGISKAIPGHNIPLGALGTFIVLFCWLLILSLGGLAKDQDLLSGNDLALNMLVPTCISGIISFLYTWIRYKKTDITLVLNGFLAGMIAGSAGGGHISLAGISVLGIIMGFLIVLFIEYMDKSLKIDDPVGASAVFGLGGLIGILGKGFLSRQQGILAGGGFHSFGILLSGSLLIILITYIGFGLFLFLMKKTIGIRVKPEDELEGLDLMEHGLVSSYYDFTYNIHTTDYSEEYFQQKTGNEKKETILNKKSYSYPEEKTGPGVLTKIEIITRKEKFEDLKTALNDIGVTGMTVTPVSGYGVQKGYNEFYRGVPMDVQLRSKIKIEIIITKVPVEQVVNTARRVLYTGYAGDGKIFIYSLNDVIRVRTGENGYDALQIASADE